MAAVLFTLLLIVYWLLLGLSLQLMFKFRVQFHFRLLTAAPLGLATNIIVLFLLSRVGLPISQVAVPLFVLGLVCVVYAGILLKRNWRYPTVRFYMFLILFSIAPFSWPLLKFGFEWLAFVNGDMSYYSLSASRFLDYGFSELPASGNIDDETDYSLAYWYFPNVIGHRAGADLLLAQIVGVSGLSAQQVYMPLIIACHVGVATSAGALTLLGVRKWAAALWTMILVALSPMLSLEVTKQLLAQAAGLGLLVSACSMYVMTMRNEPSLRWAGASVLLISGLAIAYSEVLPFFIIFAFVHELARWRIWLDKTVRRKAFYAIGLVVLGTCLLLNAYLIDVAKFLLLAVDGSNKSSAMTVQSDGLSLFPNFLVPSAGALLLGWMPFGVQSSQPVVIAGLIGLAGISGLALYASRKGIPASLLMVVMLLMAVAMYISGNGFGLFKLAMFSQPFILSMIVALATLLISLVALRQAVFALLSVSLMPAQWQNVMQVSGEIGQTRVPYASSSKLGEQLRKLGDAAKNIPNLRLYSDTPIREFFLLQSYYFKHTYFSPLSLPTVQEFREEKFKNNLYLNKLSDIHETIVEKKFYFFPEETNGPATIKVDSQRDLDDAYLITTSREFSPINRSTMPVGKNLLMVAQNELRNHLVFRNNSRGLSYVDPAGKWKNGGLAYWGIQPDPIFRGDTMAAIGRYHVYEVLGAQSESRVLVAITTSMNRAIDFRLPDVRVVGARSESLPLVGRGSARVISSPILPVEIEKGKFLGIDFGHDGAFEAVPREGAMALFGKDIKLDIRKGVAYARDISYITHDQYFSIKRPERLSSFPEALRDPGLEYSGIYEDGWLSEKSYVVLRSPEQKEQLVLRMTGMLPRINDAAFKTEIRISVNGRAVYQSIHEPGEIKLELSLSPEILQSGEMALIQIESSELQRVPNGDERPVSFLLNDLGF